MRAFLFVSPILAAIVPSSLELLQEKIRSIDFKGLITNLAHAEGTVDATTLHWNSHRPCATDGGACSAKARSSLASMARQVGAKIVGAVEMRDAIRALPGWQNTGMQCDNSAIMVAPGWTVEKRGGFCMNGNSAKGFAVALVRPPTAVRGCAKLCVLMGHVPHEGVRSGGSEVSKVCGGYRTACGIGMGDWNSNSPGRRFNALFGTYPKLTAPTHELTCCYRAPSFKYAFDHTVTNIRGAYSSGTQVFGPQLTRYQDYDEHKPTSVKLRLPSA